ncbi:MAG: iron-containing alcohol dehydrogenase [Spirochaetes bacterium]|nr:iron-containing alcohol dehydrogenase [Spirochaetota bacterium]
MEAFSFHSPRQVFIGKGEVERIPEILLRECPKRGRILVLTDQGVVASGGPQRIVNRIATEGFTVELVDSVPREPYSKDVDELSAQLRDKGFEFIVGVGGGSVLDTAKLLSILLSKKTETVGTLLEKGVPARGIPTLMVPTTAGTGSEATPNAIVALRDKQLKVGIVSPFLVPSYVVLDPDTTVGLPPALTASTGLDALCHLLECYISKKANPFSDLLALEGMRLVFSSLRKAFTDGSDLEARYTMLLASFYGGLCIASSSTTAVHALSYPLGGAYRIPHGVANAMLLVPVMEFNRDSVVEKLTEAAVRIGIRQGPGDSDLSVSFLRSLSNLVQDLKIPSRLGEFGIQKTVIPELTERALQVTRLLSNNPKLMGREEIQSIYERIL